MKRLAIAAVLAGIVALVAGYARAQDLPWKPADPNAPPVENPQPAPPAGAPGEAPPAEVAAAEKPAVDLEKALKPELYQRAIKPILYQIEQADKVLGLYNKEMAKPAKDRNQAKARAFREKVADYYFFASRKAQDAKKMVSEATYQDAITNQYEIPMRHKALEIHLALAEEEMQKRNLKGAIAQYQQILKIDPENAVAKEELKKIEAAVKAHTEGGQTTRQAGSGGKDEKDQDSIRRPDQDYIDKHNHDEYTPGDYQDRYSRDSKYR
jgi:tetratricopeptide (TPR) repeat protein